ncbi:MAG TPA: ABC transporter substrate-binding protein [Roseiarcus sp.]|jgi:branched-chain amino acid transport system substrate-binding protein
MFRPGSIPQLFLAAAIAMTLGVTPSRAQVSDDVVKIGVLGDESGPFADAGGLGTILAAKMAVEDFGGKVLGKPIEIIHANHQNKPDVAMNIARHWIDVEHVDAFLSLTLSPVALAVQGLANSKKKTVMVTGASTTELTGKSCSPYASQWLEDSYTLTSSVIKASSPVKGNKWFFITVDNAYGLAMLKDGERMVKETGGDIVGSVRHPLGSADMSSYLLQAQASGADDIALANVGLDTMNAAKQAQEFNIIAGGKKLLVFSAFVTDIDAIGLDIAQGLVLPSGFYWDDNEQTRAFAKRFFAVMKKMPTNSQATAYAATMHYLKAVQAAGTDDTEAVNEKMRSMPVDYFGRVGSVRADGRVTYDITLYQVKSPAESKYPWDYMKPIGTVSQMDAFRPLSESECPLVKK